MVSKGVLILLISLLIFSPFITSLDTIKTVKQGEVIRIPQVCSNANYVNITSITYPNSSVAVSNIQMSSNFAGDFFYDFSDTTALGRYDVVGISDGCEQTFATYFDVTPSGKGGVDNMVFIIIVIVVLYGITLIGFFGRNIPMTVLGGMANIFLGIYIIRNGLVIYRDNLTLYFSYFTIGLGALLALWALLEFFED